MPIPRNPLATDFVTLKQVLAIVSLVGAGVGTVAIYAVGQAWDAKEYALMARPDPFTGTDGRAMEAKLIGRDQGIMEALRRECTLNTARIDAQDQRLQEQIAELKADIAECMAIGHRKVKEGRKP